MSRSDLALAGGIVLLGLIVRANALARADLWSDEAVSWEVASAPASQVCARTAEREAKPPLYFLALHAWMRVFGDGEASMRSLSALFWLPLGALLVGLGRRCCGRAWVLPALLGAMSPLLIHYGVEARPYSMLLCAETAFVWLALRAEADVRLAPRVWLAAGSFAVLSLQFTGLFFVVPVLLALLLPRCREPRELARILLPQLAAGLIYAGALAVCMPGILAEVALVQQTWWAAFPSWVQVLSSPARLIAPVQTWNSAIDLAHPSGLFLVPAAGLLLVLGVGGWAFSPQRRLLIAAGAGPLGLVVLYSLFRANLLFERYYIGCAPLLYLGAGAAIEAVGTKRPAWLRGTIAATVVAQGLLFLLLPALSAWTGYKDAVNAVLASERGPVAILTAGWDGPAVRYYCRRETGRVRLLDWTGSAELPLYYVHSDSWGERYGVITRALEAAGRPRTIWQADRVIVDRVDRR